MYKSISIPIIICTFIGVFNLSGCSSIQSESGQESQVEIYDMREELNPSRLTIAMWDFSWLYQHYEGGYFEDFDKMDFKIIESKIK